MPNLTVHGVNFIRTGSCNRCPDHQPAPCCLGCIHFAIKGNKNTCEIYDTRANVCTTCTASEGRTVTHQECIDFPEHPFLYVATQHICSFMWAVASDGDRIKYQALLDLWGLPSAIVVG